MLLLLGVRIFGIDCINTCEWLSPTKLLVIVPLPASLQTSSVFLRSQAAASTAAGRRGANDDISNSDLVSEVIVETKSGGVGTCTVQFRAEPLPSTPSEVAAYACKSVSVWFDELRYLPLPLPTSKSNKCEARARQVGASPDEDLLELNTNTQMQSASNSLSNALTNDQLCTMFPGGMHALMHFNNLILFV